MSTQNISSGGTPRAHPHALWEVWSLAWPTVLTMTSHTVMQFVDKLMVGQVGPLEVAAQGNGGIWAFTPIAIFMGFVSVVNTYVSQHYGAGRAEEGPKYAWNALWLSAAVWCVFLLPGALFMPRIFRQIHGPEQGGEFARLVVLEAGYGRILLAGSILTLSSRALHQFFFGLQRPKIITVSAILGNTANVVMNYILIFGRDGLPQMGLPGVPGVRPLGLHGAALGTVVGTAVELVVPACVFLGPRLHREFRVRSAWRPTMSPIRDLLRIGWPPAVQYGNELICWSIFMTVLVARFGPDHMTAGWIALSYMHLSFMPAVGFSVAVNSLVGRYIGAGQPDLAVSRARIGLFMAVGYMTACGVLFVVFRHSLIGAFVGGDVSAERATQIVRIGSSLLVCAAVFQMADAVGIVYTGALRGAGDTRWPGIVTMIYSWVFIVAGGLAMARLLPRLESIGPWIASAVYIIVLGITMGRRFESGRWRSIQLLTHPEPGAVAALVPAPPGIEIDAAGEYGLRTDH